MAVILFGVFIALLLLGVPVAFAICSAAATTMFAGFGDAKMMIVVQRMFASCDSFSLIAVPFFIFAGDLLAGGRISKVLVEFCESLLGMIKGGLSVVSVLAGMFFAAISGSGPAGKPLSLNILWGISLMVMVETVLMITIRSTIFFSSRTFPGQL